MKKFTTLLLLLVMCVLYADAQAVIGGRNYRVDTIMHRQIGPGVMQTIVRIPEYPLNVYMLEVDVTNKYNRVETTQAKNTLGATEKLADAYVRHKSYGKKPLAACNASFWCVSSQIPWYNFMPGVPHGAEVVNDTIYVNTNRNGVFDFNGGTVNTASTIIDKAGKVHVGRHEWYGCVKSPKFSADQEIIQVNKCCDYNQLVLFNHARGRNSKFFTYPTGCYYVFLKLKEDSKWAIAKDIKFEVAKIEEEADNQVLGNYDACLIADGAYKNEMSKLAVGDEVAINTYWFDYDGDRTPIEVENMTEGEAHVMLKGEITNRANGDYGAMVYSRTAYGCNKEGTKLYMLVIDKSVHPIYGNSVGCTATVMCQLWKSLVPDLWNVANMDAGGSAQMMVGGTVLNKTTEATPRAVANGMMLFSTAPDEDNDVITALKFADVGLKSPIYYSFTPKVLGYNKYGELISENVPVTFSCAENVGTVSADGTVIEVGGTVGMGTVTAHYENLEVTAPIEVLNSDFSIRVKPMILIDAKREYPIEITTVVGKETLSYDAGRFLWEVEDKTVACVENGVLRGLKEGITKIKASLGNFSDETTVKVEIASSPIMYQSWNDWTVTSANLSADAVLDEIGKISYGFGGKRKATIKLEKDIVAYSLPDSYWLEFTTSTALNNVTMDIRSALMSDVNEIMVTPTDIPAGTYKINLLDYVGGGDDIANFPISIRNMTFSISSKSGYVKGDNTIDVKLYGEYGSYQSGIENITTVENKIKILPGANKFVISTAAIEKVNVEIYDMTGTVLYNRELMVNGGNVEVYPELPAGAYIVKATGAGESAVCKMIEK